jgi:hypothetical protein
MCLGHLNMIAPISSHPPSFFITYMLHSYTSVVCVSLVYIVCKSCVKFLHLHKASVNICQIHLHDPL